MTLKKMLSNKKAQAAVEYILVFLAIVATILVTLGGFNEKSANIRNIFGTGQNDLIVRTRNWLNIN